MRTIIARSCALAAILIAASMAVSQAKNLKDIEITDEFPIDRCADSLGLVTSCIGTDCNAYLPLIVGRVWELDNFACEDCDEFEKVRVSMLDETETVDGQIVRVMEEREWVGDDPEDLTLVEVSRNFLVMCPNTQDVFYFGEDECIDPEDEDAEDEPPFEPHFDCESIGLAYIPEGDGAWRAGLPGAEAGMLMQGGSFLLNATYFQEQAEDYGALDWAQNAELGLSEAGFDDCVLVLDRNLLDDPKSKADGDEKVYCPGIGIVRDEDLELASCTDTGDVACMQ